MSLTYSSSAICQFQTIRQTLYYSFLPFHSYMHKLSSMQLPMYVLPIFVYQTNYLCCSLSVIVIIYYALSLKKVTHNPTNHKSRNHKNNISHQQPHYKTHISTSPFYHFPALFYSFPISCSMTMPDWNCICILSAEITLMLATSRLTRSLSNSGIWPLFPLRKASMSFTRCS